MTRIKTWLAVAGAVVLAVVAAFFRGRSAGREGLKDEQAGDTLDRLEKGREAVQRGRDGGGTPDERVRQNDGRWMP
jgi:hypothetical protein